MQPNSSWCGAGGWKGGYEWVVWRGWSLTVWWIAFWRLCRITYYCPPSCCTTGCSIIKDYNKESRFKYNHSKSHLQSLNFNTSFIHSQICPDPCLCYKIYTLCTENKIAIPIFIPNKNKQQLAPKQKHHSTPPFTPQPSAASTNFQSATSFARTASPSTSALNACWIIQDTASKGLGVFKWRRRRLKRCFWCKWSRLWGGLRADKTN